MMFAEYLHEKIPNPCSNRPFVCDGLPELCTVIVIGDNPATPMESNWWSFWNDETGFDLSRFELEYTARRRAEGKQALSNTRRRLNRLRDNGLRCLETNSFLNECANGHGSGSTNDLLDFFIQNLPHLTGIIAHGKVAQGALDRLTLPVGISSYRMRHFRSESYLNLNQVIKELKMRGQTPTPFSKTSSYPHQK